MILSIDNYELLQEIFSSTQEEIKNSMECLLEKAYGRDRMITTNEYIIAQGTIPVGIVAHMDTVHKTPVRNLYYDRDKNVMWSPEGIGADDRAGIYAIIELLRRGLRPTVILTTDEETGATGAVAVASSYDNVTADINFLIELDRRGGNDCVFYDCDNSEFEDYITKFGFVYNWGSFSDICYIAPEWGMAAVNLSIGYYDEHTLTETLNVTDMYNTIDRVEKILNEVKPEDYFEYVESKKNSTFGYGGYNYGSETFGFESSVGTVDTLCWGCVGAFSKEVMIKVDKGYYCGDCYAKNFTTCIDCGKEFEDKFKIHLKCDCCRKKK